MRLAFLLYKYFPYGGMQRDFKRFIEENKQGPFFVYLAHTMPHTKLAASKDFAGKSKRGLYGDVMEEIDFNV